MKVSKNYYRGGEITDLNEIVRLANNKESVVLEIAGKFNILRPASFILGMQLNYILRNKVYYSYHKDQITEVEFEN